MFRTFSIHRFACGPGLLWFAMLLATVAVVGGCSRDGPRPSSIRVAVTTSTRDSGLLDELLPAFEAAHGVRVDVIAVGTGAALKLGESRDVDVLLVHARRAEDAFMAAGHGVRREDVMYNTFEIVGPENDPAGVADLSPADALHAIASMGLRFISRGDDSGTHKRELELWQKSGGRPNWDGYIECGQGMGAALNMANQMSAYTLVDRGTYLWHRERIDLVSLVKATDDLHNPYGIMVVANGETEGRNDDALDASHRFVDFMISEPTQRRIADYRVNGQTLFHPLHLAD